MHETRRNVPVLSETPPGSREPICSWAQRIAMVQPGDAGLPDTWTGVNQVLNRMRLARWLQDFEADRHVKDFLVLDALASWLQVPLSSTGLVDRTPTLAVRPFRLWEYVWLFKGLKLARGGMRVLDIGGPSSHLTMLAALFGNFVESVDISKPFVDAGNRAAEELQIGGYRAIVADGRDLSRFPNACFDAVLCCSVLEHLTGEDQNTVLRQVSRVLRPGGKVGLTFDYGRSAAGMNEYLPPPHEPPPDAEEVIRRYEVPGLSILGNRDFEDPVDGSLFVDTPISYTMCSLFLGSAPLNAIDIPESEPGESEIADLEAIANGQEVDRWVQLASTKGFLGTAREAVANIEAACSGTRAIKLLMDVGIRDSEIGRWQNLSNYYQGETQRLSEDALGLNREISNLKTEVSELHGYMSDLIGQATRLHEDISTLNQELSRREAALIQAAATERVFSAQIQDSAARESALRNELNAREQETQRLAKTFDQLNSESLAALGFRKWLRRIPGAHNHYVLSGLPRWNKIEAALAIAHRLVTAHVERRVARAAHIRRQLPRVTVVTPCFNSQAYIERAIQSVLGQGYSNLEYFIEDGGSTDSTLAIAEKYRNQLAGIYSEPDQGMYDAIGRGFARSTGEILCYLNSDDVFLPGALQRIGDYFAAHPRANVIYHEDVVDTNGWRYANVPQPRVGFQELLKGHILFQDGVFFRRKVYEAAGGVNRSLKLAGDWDLWTRLALQTDFERRPGHMSCFYVRPGQLSSRMDDYRAEMERCRRNIAASLPPLARIVQAAKGSGRTLINTLERKIRPERLVFPIDFEQQPPPPGLLPAADAAPVRCPLTKQFPERLLFSSRDTRFGNELINQIHYVSASHLTICSPPLSESEFSELYQRHYSDSNPGVIQPDPRFGSPYRQWRGRGLVLRFVRNILAPRILSRIVKITWDDTTGRDLVHVLKKAGVNVGAAHDFLDIGCFEGHLLDELRSTTRWRLAGAEPNPAAVRACQAKGHEVFQASALEAATTIPLPMRFSIIFLGQVLEHIDEPERALRSLSTLLKPGGVMVISTPNLDSKQIDLFGPTWSHWHPPYHRFIYSVGALEKLGIRAGLRMHLSRTFSYPYWTALSIYLNRLGLGGSVPHGIQMPWDVVNLSRSIVTWARLFWDWRGKGDSIFAVFFKDTDA